MKTIIALFALLFAGALAQECSVYLPDWRDIIVMDAEQRGPGGGWEFMSSLGGYQGSGYLVYKPYSNFGGAEPKPENMNDPRIKTYSFKVNTPGRYRVVLKSAAPHGTEHNDIFMSLPESGAYMRRHGEWRDLTWPLDTNADWDAWVDGSNWFKVYQNSGGLQWNYGGKTVDFEGHDIITRELEAGVTYTVRICGRSTQFNVDRIALYHCVEGQCDNGSARFNEATTGWGNEQSMCEVWAPVALPMSVPVERSME